MSKKNGKGDMDRISGLPDSILLHILSFLPTQTCVSTLSLVSRRWRHLWEQLQVFDFFGDYCEDDDIKLVKKFVFFVNAVLTLGRSRDILKLRLFCGIMEQGEFSMIEFVNLWVHAAIGPRLEELRLELYGEIVVLPHTVLFNCSNLVSLSLIGHFDLKNEKCSWELVHFPSLKYLFLDVDCMVSIDAFLTGCPILETFNTTDASDSSWFSVPPSLKRLQYHNFGFIPSTYIDIDAPCLEYLSIATNGTFETTVGNLHNVVKAYIDVSFLDVNHLLNLLRAISGTKHLTLGYSTTLELLPSASIRDFPEFRYLLHLDLTLPHFNSNLLAKVLENCHVLQDFVIVINKRDLPGQIWDPQSTIIPNCLVSHLTSIYIKGYYGLEDELTFEEYILRNALVLKTMIITSEYTLGLKDSLCILKKISNIPRGSLLCHVEFKCVVSP